MREIFTLIPLFRRGLKCNFEWEFAVKTKRVYTRAVLQRIQTSSIARNETSSTEIDRSNSYSTSFSTAWQSGGGYSFGMSSPHQVIITGSSGVRNDVYTYRKRVPVLPAKLECRQSTGVSIAIFCRYILYDFQNGFQNRCVPSRARTRVINY